MAPSPPPTALTMRWLFAESILKGIFIGLLGFVAFQEPSWNATATLALSTLCGLVVFLGIAGWLKVREGYQVKGRLPAFCLFLLLESPGLVYAGVLLGLGLAAYWRGKAVGETWLVYALLAGAGLGVVFWLLRQVGHRWVRFGLGLALACALVAGALYWVSEHPHFLDDPAVRTPFGVQFLFAIPVFYLLTLAGRAEESEVEVGVMCAALGLALWALLGPYVPMQWFIFLVPLGLYYVYTRQILPGLKVFKHVVRGIGFANVGRYRPALQAYRRALQLDPKNPLARQGLWSLHRSMDLEQVGQDAETLALVDYDLCMERAASLLLEAGPRPQQLAEAHHLLDLVASQRPNLQAAISYWRAVAHTHAREFDQAVTHLERVLDKNAWTADDPSRASVLFPAWQLALTLHPEINRRFGTRQLSIPGRCMEGIAAVERQLAGNTEDSGAWDLKRLLYSSLKESDYDAAVGPNGVATDFDHGYTHQLGLALINDPAQWQRGAEYLRMAARGLPAQGPTIYLQIAQAYHRAGDNDAVWTIYDRAKQAGQAVGPKNLGPEDRQAFFAIVKILGEDARARNDLEAAIEDYRLLAESERSGLETLRILAELYERKGDVFSALRSTEQALVYNAADKDLLEKKDRYYYSLMPEDLRVHLEAMRTGFDVEYCLRKARTLLDYKDADADVIQWAQHLTELALVVLPESLAARVIQARACRRLGDIDRARVLLEEVYAKKTETFANRADEEAWFLTCRLLGEMYLNELAKPDLAVACFNEFRKSSKSGADTLYKLGQAYEQLGDRAKAARYYENVTAYESHPLAPDARQALYRLKDPTPS